MSVLTRRGRPAHPDVLTPAEWRVVDAVRHGMTNRLIAKRMGHSADAVKFHLANALSKLGLANRRALRAWTGVRADSLLAAKETPMQTTLALGPLGQISRGVTDIEAAVSWYGGTLGLRHLYTFGKLAFFDLGGVRLFLEEGAGGPQSVLYFQVDDIRTAHEEMLERGVEFVSAPHRIHRHEDGTEEWMAFFNDNEGRYLAIMSQVRPTPGQGRDSGALKRHA
jgi:DNA-binding CsgD family transcriptional regulator/catechol 2,3-dioxygenase-like lactoylglutathione lyase family enzyme